MSTDPLKTSEAIATSVAKVSDSKGLVALAQAIPNAVAALAIVGVALIPVAIAFGSKWNGELHPKPNCFDLKEVAGKVYRFNTCTGVAEEIVVAAVPKSSTSKPSDDAAPSRASSLPE